MISGFGTERGHEDRRRELPAEQLKGDIRIGIRAQSVHVDADFLPLVEVASSYIAWNFAAGTRHGIRAGTTIADRAGFAVRSDTFTGGC